MNFPCRYFPVLRPFCITDSGRCSGYWTLSPENWRNTHSHIKNQQISCITEHVNYMYSELPNIHVHGPAYTLLIYKLMFWNCFINSYNFWTISYLENQYWPLWIRKVTIYPPDLFHLLDFLHIGVLKNRPEMLSLNDWINSEELMYYNISKPGHKSLKLIKNWILLKKISLFYK